MQWIRPFTNRFVNPATRLVAGRLPGFAILRYRGRRTGRRYAAPMNVFRDDEGYVFALTYSSGADWVRNVLAAGGCEMVTRGRTIRLFDPRVIVDPARRLVPQPVRFFLGLLRVTEFLRMREAPAP
jgi:deazaflavin-dependent oxidoreductase (nitroreductase family)